MTQQQPAEEATSAPKTWFITGASRGLGSEIAKAALRAGDRVVAAGRTRSAIAAALGPNSDRLLALELDVTQATQAQAAIDAAMARFAGIDVLVNNAGYGYYGFFEESTIDDARAQFETNLFGVFNVTWAALPTMRSAGKGHIFNVSSLGGLMGGPMASLYCASKFALEGFSESLAKEVAPFGVAVTIVEPGPFRTDFLTPASLRLAHNPLADYDVRRTEILAGIDVRNGNQPGDPERLGSALIRLANQSSPPMRFLAGSIALGAAEEKLAAMRVELDEWRPLSKSADGNYGDSNVGDLQSLMR
jgi:NAD(P)-dependent dehydrogenase (short-subunit alcohol dehydrogenase family)